MNCLLDTHTLLWTLFNSRKLSSKAKEAIGDIKNSVYVSLISYWEISLKYALGKIELENISPQELPAATRESGFEILPITAEEVASFHKLPCKPHKDPFDRLITWQAIHNGLVLVSKDRRLSDYKGSGLRILW